jgi:MFS family permease
LVAASIFIKHITLWLVWGLLVRAVGGRRAAIILLVIGVLFGAALLPFALSSDAASINILQQVALYQGYGSGYGLNALFPRWLVSIVFYATMIVLPFRVRALPLMNALTLMMTVYMILTPGFAVTHAALLIALWGLTAPRWAIVASVPLAVVALLRPFAEYDVLPLIQNVFWGMCALFLTSRAVPVPDSD